MAGVNKVIAGDYTGRSVKIKGRKIQFCRLFEDPVVVDDTTVSRYAVVDQDVTKSGASALVRGMVGRSLLGRPGMYAGMLSAKNKYHIIISIEFNNGDKSLIEVDKRVYKFLMRKLYI